MKLVLEAIFFLCFSLMVTSIKVQKFTLVVEHTILAGKSKRQIAFNGTVPGPMLNITLGNSVELTVINNINDAYTSLHLHGLKHHGTPFSDGVPLFTQCTIPNTNGNNTFIYTFTPDVPGTYWYHGNYEMHYSDGMYGPIVIYDSNEIQIFTTLGAVFGSVDWTLMFADWYNVPVANLANDFLSSDGSGPLPDAITVNNLFSGQFQATIDPNGKPIRVRVLNVGSLSMMKVSVDGVPLTLIELDATRIQPIDLQSILLHIGQRCSFVLDFTRIDPSLADASGVKIRFSLLPDRYPQYNASAPHFNLYGSSSKKPLNLNWEGLIKFEGRNYPIDYKTIPFLYLPSQEGTNFLNAKVLTASVAPKPDYTFYIHFYFAKNAQGFQRAYMNGYSYEAESQFGSQKKTPLLYEYMYGPEVSDYSGVNPKRNRTLVGDPRNPVIIPFGKCVEIFINNTSNGEHPFHLHGYKVWLVSTSIFPNAGTLFKNNYIVRDAVSVPAHGWARFRVLAQNPGVWMFRCHIPWHQIAGAMITFVVAPSMLKNHSGWMSPIPQSQLAACNVPIKRIIKIGGYFNVINPTNVSQLSLPHAQSMAAFMMAINEINENPNLLPNFELRVVVRSGTDDFSGAVRAAEYLSLNAEFQNYVNPSSMYVSGTNKGVDVVVGAGSNIETMGMNQFLNGRQIVQVHTVANDPQLQVGANYPFKIGTVPTSPFEGLVLHILGCQYFHYRQVIIFSANDIYGSSTSNELRDMKYCTWKIRALYSFSADTTDFSTEIGQAKDMHVQVFILVFNDAVIASRLVEQAYNIGLFREGTQVFGSEAVTSPLLWQSFQNKKNTAAIMKGFIGIHYDPSYTMKTTARGAEFINKFRALPSIAGSTNSCYVGKSDIFSLDSLTVPAKCKRLNFSSFSPDGSDMYPYTPHAYDAVYAVAYALNDMFETNQARTMDGKVLSQDLLDPYVVNFAGVTGAFKIYSGSPVYPFNKKGDREVGVTYKIFNYNVSLGDFAFVGTYSDKGITLCDSKTRLLDGSPCQSIVYNTRDNLPAGNFAPFSQDTTPRVIKLGGFFKPFDDKNVANIQQAQCLAAFLMAIKEINANKALLPKTRIVSGIVSGAGFIGAITAATELTQVEFGGTGVNIVVGAGDDAETLAMNQIFSQSNTIQIHTISQAVELSQGESFPWRIQTSPLASYQGHLLQTIGCKFLKLKRVTVFVIDSLLGSATLSDFQSTASECTLTLVATLTLKHGESDFSSALSKAKSAQTRLFALLLYDPGMAGRLLEQGYQSGLFAEGTAILATDAILTPLTWRTIKNTKNIPAIMKGLMGVQFFPELGVMSTPQGRAFLKKFISQPSTQFTDASGSISCDSNSLDDSGEFFLYSHRDDSGSVCGGLDFPRFNASGMNVYPYAAHVYDAVYVVAYAADYLFNSLNRTKLVPTEFYNTLIARTRFTGASGLMEFTPGSSFYPHNNRGNREEGHDYLIVQFNKESYQSSVNGSEAFVVVGVFDPWNISHVCEVGYRFVNGKVCWNPVYNTYNGFPPVNNQEFVSLATSIQIVCYVLFGLLLSVTVLCAALTFRYRSYKVIHDNQREMIYLVIFGAFLFAIRILLTSFHVNNATCEAKMWIGHTAFFIFYGALFRQVWAEFTLMNSHRLVFQQAAKVFSSEKAPSRLNSGVTASSSLSLSTRSVKQNTVTGIDKLTTNLMLYLVLYVEVHLFFASFFGKPKSTFVTTHFNLYTTRQSICSMELPIIESVLYLLEGLFLLLGIGICVLLRPYLDRLVESRGNMLSIFSAIGVVFLVTVAILVIRIQGSGMLSDDTEQLASAIGCFIFVLIVLLLLCFPPFYLILSIQYDGLLIHQILMDGNSNEKHLLDVIETNKTLMYRQDRYGHNAFQVALEYNVSDEILLELIHYFLPFDPLTKESISPENHGYVWTNLVQKDRNADLVDKILNKYAFISLELSKTTDMEGRSAINIAGQSCQRYIKESTYFCKRYEITTYETPVHLSRTCMVHIALDHRHHGEKVALKLMKNHDQYIREIKIRKDAQLSKEFTITVLRSHDVITSEKYKEDIKRSGWDDFEYCIVMPCADRDLNRIITNEHIAGKNWGQIKTIAVQIAQALQHIHQNGVIHGDVKSKNIVRIDHKVKFIDFDASVTIGKDFVGAKCSSAFVPPEMIFFIDATSRSLSSDKSSTSIDSKRLAVWKQYSDRYFEEGENIGVKSYEIDMETKEIIGREKLPYELIIAQDSFDVWAFGVVLFELCAGIPLFLANSEDNILYEAMLDLHAFTEKYKKKRMSEISNLDARNLIAQMLMRNPSKRPHMAQVLAHPFLSGKKATRMLGETAQFDVFLSYRKQSDENHAQLLYEKLTAAGLKVWWDKKSLLPGVPWQEGFCDGLVKSSVFIPILSREAINSSSVEKQNYTLLSRSSPCDNVLLEHRLALELVERGTLLCVYPVLVGDIVMDRDKELYTDYFSSGCHPTCTNKVVVDSVENTLQDHLNRLCFGTPLLDNMTVPLILEYIVRNQGCLVEGPVDIAFDDVVPDVLSILKGQHEHKEALSDISEKSDRNADEKEHHHEMHRIHRANTDLKDPANGFKLHLPHRHHSMDIRVTQVIEESPIEVMNFSDKGIQ